MVLKKITTDQVSVLEKYLSSVHFSAFLLELAWGAGDFSFRII